MCSGLFIVWRRDGESNPEALAERPDSNGVGLPDAQPLLIYHSAFMAAYLRDLINRVYLEAALVSPTVQPSPGFLRT